MRNKNSVFLKFIKIFLFTFPYNPRGRKKLEYPNYSKDFTNKAEKFSHPRKYTSMEMIPPKNSTAHPCGPF
ncbi:hypothetical protein CJF12_13995 [Chryseobacterium piperi]|nr:hypothetical protein CJF12_13995 [Chryseobacterium piperi]